MQTLEAIHARASLKACLSARDVEREKIDKLLDAARAAPSARNTQPWRFVVITDRKVIDALLAEAMLMPPDATVRSAPVWIIAFANPKDDVNHDGKDYYLYDVGSAMENLVLAATDLGLVTHLMAALNEQRLRSLLEVPADYRFVIATPLSYPLEGSYEEAARPRLMQRRRKAPAEVAYRNRWGRTS